MAARADPCDNGPMATKDQISIADAISPLSSDEAGADVLAWQIEKLRERHKAADAGRFASKADVKAVIRKFIPDG